MDDVKSSAQAENNAAKTMALDHLGVIAARLRSNAVHHVHSKASLEYALKPLDEVSSIFQAVGLDSISHLQITASLDIKALDLLVNAHQDVFSYLSKRSTEDQAYNVSDYTSIGSYTYVLSRAHVNSVP